MAKKKKYEAKSFEGTITYINENGYRKTDTSANIFHSMLVSKAFQSLTPKQKIVYLCMKDLYYSVPQHKHPFNDNNYFYFNQHLWKDVYKIHTNGERLRADIDALIEKGFIEEIENNKNLRQKNIYKYSDKWKTYDDDK